MRLTGQSCLPLRRHVLKRCATTQTGCGTSEDTARRYFWQLLSGVGYCHCNGVCHRSSRRTRGVALMLRCFDAHTLRRDLKPENLLLSDGSESAVLKVRRANARFCEDHTCDLSIRARRLLTSGSLRRLRLPPAVTTTRKQRPLSTLAARSFEVGRRFASLCRGGHDGSIQGLCR